MAEAWAELEALAFRLKVAGETDLQRELSSRMRDAVEPVQGDIRAGLIPKLPDRYAEVLDDDLSITTSIRSSTSNPGVRLRGTTRGRNGVQRRRLNRLNSGILEHPLWGNREYWKKQPVPPGWFTQPAEDAAPRVREALVQVLSDVADQATSKGP